MKDHLPTSLDFMWLFITVLVGVLVAFSGYELSRFDGRLYDVEDAIRNADLHTIQRKIHLITEKSDLCKLKHLDILHKVERLEDKIENMKPENGGKK